MRYRNFLVQEHLPDRFAASNEYLQSPTEIEGGKLPVLDGPRLGVDIDESALSAYVDEATVVCAE